MADALESVFEGAGDQQPDRAQVVPRDLLRFGAGHGKGNRCGGVYESIAFPQRVDGR